MAAKQPPEFSYLPPIWPALVVASCVAAVIRFLPFTINHKGLALIFCGTACIIAVLIVLFLFRKKAGIIPIVLPSYNWKVRLFRAAVGLIWGSITLVVLFNKHLISH
jgi:hypothetical protein